MSGELKATTRFGQRETPSFEQLEAKAMKVGKEKLTRTTIDLPANLHKSIKIKAVMDGKSIRDYIIELIQKDINPEG